MSLNRRELLRFGAMAAGGAMLSVVGQLADPAVAGLPAGAGFARSARAAHSRAPAAAAAPGGIDPQLFARAKAALDQHRSAPATISAWSTSRSRRASRASTSSTCATARSKAFASPTAAARTPTMRASRALLERFRLLRFVERHLHDRRLLSRQVRALDEDPRPRLVELQCRAARDRHPQRLVRRARTCSPRTASSAAARAASPSRATTSGR